MFDRVLHEKYNRNCSGDFRLYTSDGKGVSVRNIYTGEIRSFEYIEWNAGRIWREIDKLCGYKKPAGQLFPD